MTASVLDRVPATRRRARPADDRRHPLAIAVVVLAVAVVLVPVAYLFSVSLMDRSEVAGGILFTTDPKWSNWADALFGSTLASGIRNSLVAAIGGAVLTLLFAVPAAWTIARHGTGGRTLASTLMAPWLLPPIVAVVPLFVLLRVLGLNNTLLGLTLVYALINVPIAVLLLEGFVRRLPVELDEAAALDGAGTLRTLVQVVVPLIAPGIIAVGIITAVLNYNEYLLAVFITQSEQSQTMPVVLSLFLGERLTHLGKIAAASSIAVVPVFAAAVFLQRWLVAGLTAGAVR